MFEDGTYIKTAGELLRVEAKTGYWVATEETTLDRVQDGELVGLWVDPETGKLWVDRTRYVADKETAIITARAYDQIAIWDNYNQTTIQTN